MGHFGTPGTKFVDKKCSDMIENGRNELSSMEYGGVAEKIRSLSLKLRKIDNLD